ncbi:MAG TPA: hypothetical protein VFY25_13615, partial [Anaerolineales bacterium]|nr:hypothetical protein [Anaerolineales bacterium]
QEPSFELWYTDFADCTEFFRHLTEKTAVSVVSVYKPGILSAFLEKTIKRVPVLIDLAGEWEYNGITIFPRNGGKYHGKSSI